MKVKDLIKEENPIYQFRTRYGLTQAQMGKLINRKERQIRNLENGNTKLSDDVLFRLDMLKKTERDYASIESKYDK